jgi:CPA2 family monovalent cation:H+ antiporter-2
MPHDVTLISTIAIGFGLALVLGYLAHRLGLPPLVGYLAAGVAVGPSTPGFVADAALAGQLAEIGVMLLMFGVGLHFSVADLLAVWRLAVPGAIGQILVATAMGAAMMKLAGWSLGASIVLGLSLSVASTVVMLKALEERQAVATPNGRVAVGWLVVEDLAMVLVLVLLPAFAGALGGGAGPHGGAPAGQGLWTALALTLGKVASFVALALLFGPRLMPWLLRQVARTGSRELFTLAVLAIALGIAYGSAKLFDVSFALGAFFAGVVLNGSDLSHKAATSSLPLQDAFAVLFFVSVGMLFDPSVVVRAPLLVAGVLLMIVVGKSLVAMAIVLLLRFPLSTALMVAASLAQIGEFSFILAGLGIAYGLMAPEGLNLVLAGALVSIILNPAIFSGVDRLRERMARRSGLAGRLEAAGQPRFAALERDLETARARAAEKAAARKTFTPEELVDRFPLFSGLTREQREVLILHFEPAAAQPGDRIIEAGEAADKVYFIASGEVEVTVGRERIKLGAGDHFGEIALITGQPRTATVTATDYSKFATLSRRDFLRFLQRFPSIREPMLSLATERAQRARQADIGTPVEETPAQRE